MNRSRNYLGSLSVIGLIVLLMITWGLDALMIYLRRIGPTLVLPTGILWARAMSSLLLAALLSLLFWFVLTRAPRSVWVAALYLLVGLFLGFFQVLYFVPAIGGWMPLSFYGPLLSAPSYTVLAGSFIAITGLFMLMLPSRPRMGLE